MRRKTPYDDQLVVGLTNISRLAEKSPATMMREVERGEWPCVTINQMMLANKAKLMAAKAAKEAARKDEPVKECA
jgi:hypothetical protein